MPTCNNCMKEAPVFGSLGGLKLCHKCAHDFGLSHKHEDMGITDTTHALTDFSPKAEVEAHLKAYQEHQRPITTSAGSHPYI